MNARLFRSVVSLEARTRLSYRVDFWVNAVVGFVIEVAVAWYLWDAIFRATGKESFGGRDFPATVLYYLAVFLVGRFVRGVDFDAGISTDIYEGGLSRYLVFPVGYRPFKYAQVLGKLVPVLLQVFLFALVAVPLLGVAARVHLTAGQVLMASVAVAFANLLQFLIVFPLHAVAFWADNVWSLLVGQRLLAQILGGFMLPLAVFPDWSVPLLELLPFRFLFDFPARVLLGEIAVGEWARGLLVAGGWCLVFAAAGSAVWRRGLRQYSGVGM